VPNNGRSRSTAAARSAAAFIRVRAPCCEPNGVAVQLPQRGSPRCPCQLQPPVRLQFWCCRRLSSTAPIEPGQRASSARPARDNGTWSADEMRAERSARPSAVRALYRSPVGAKQRRTSEPNHSRKQLTAAARSAAAPIRLHEPYREPNGVAVQLPQRGLPRCPRQLQPPVRLQFWCCQRLSSTAPIEPGQRASSARPARDNGTWSADEMRAERSSTLLAVRAPNRAPAGAKQRRTSEPNHSRNQLTAAARSAAAPSELTSRVVGLTLLRFSCRSAACRAVHVSCNRQLGSSFGAADASRQPPQ
jgi:hypothetical protein